MTISSENRIIAKLGAKKKVENKKISCLRSYSGPIIPKVLPQSFLTNPSLKKIYPKEKWIIEVSDSVNDTEKVVLPKRKWIFADSDSEESGDEDEYWPMTEKFSKIEDNKPENI